jgi:hypothetical protein
MSSEGRGGEEIEVKGYNVGGKSYFAQPGTKGTKARMKKKRVGLQ